MNNIVILTTYYNEQENCYTGLLENNGALCEYKLTPNQYYKIQHSQKWEVLPFDEMLNDKYRERANKGKG